MKKQSISSPLLLSVASFSFVVSSCGEVEQAGNTIDGLPVYWHAKDDFAKSEAHYLQVNFWADDERKHYLGVQLQCFRNAGANAVNEYNMLVSSQTDDPDEISSPPYVDAVLFKRDSQPARIYRNSYDGTVLSNFHHATLDGQNIFHPDADGSLPRRVAFRFVTGSNPFDVINGNVDALSRSYAVNYTFDASNLEVEKFLNACAPKN